MKLIEIGMAVLTITCTTWARVHYWNARKRASGRSARGAE